MAATIKYNKFSNVIAISGTPSGGFGDLLTGKDSNKNAQTEWVLQRYLWSGTTIAIGDQCTVTDGNGDPVLDLTMGVAKDTKTETFHGDGKLKSQGLYIKTLSHGTLYLYPA